jgi:hypothetical protein
MAHPRVHNLTPFAFSPIFAADLDGGHVFAPLLKASFRITPGQPLLVAPVQAPILPGGQWWGPPETASLRIEPEAIGPKPGTDVVLLGHAYPQRPGDTDVRVGLRVGPLSKVVHVFGERWWVRRAMGVSRTEPAPFERIPLQWERAFGGWDRTASNPDLHRCEPRNPVGRGFWTAWPEGVDRLPLPNLEDPHDLITSFEHRPQPMGFGFIGPNWMPRAQWAGTCDEAWMASRMPLPPSDMDPRFLQGAPADQVSAQPLRGDEMVAVVGASPLGPLQFQLPGSGVPPRFDVLMRPSGQQTLHARLDTVIVDADALTVSLLWRAAMPVSHVPADVAEVHVSWAGFDLQEAARHA